MARHIARGGSEETATERQIGQAIQRHLGKDDVLISGLRLHDNTYGDVEIDSIIHLPVTGCRGVTSDLRPVASRIC